MRVTPERITYFGQDGGVVGELHDVTVTPLSVEPVAPQTTLTYTLEPTPIDIAPADPTAVVDAVVIGDSPLAGALSDRLAGTTSDRLAGTSSDRLTGARSATPSHVVLVDAAPTRVLDEVLTWARAGSRHPPKLWLVASDAAALTARGLARVIAHEHPELAPVLVHADDPDAIAGLVRAGAPEPDLRHHDGHWHGLRLTPRPDLGAPSARVTIQQPGDLDTLRLEPCPRGEPAAGEVEIAVDAVGLNFLDVLGALGVRPDADAAPLLGAECAGRIAAVGPEVNGWSTGDPVVAIVPHGLATHAIADARLLARRPERCSAIDAATIPIAFATAWYGLVDLARLEAGERVLIHSATGGVGLAAIQIARARGAEIVATAGSDTRRAYLRSLGIDVVADSRDPRFADAIREAVGEVDVVLNSLTGDAVAEGLRLLSAGGRFVEIAKLDIHAGRALPLAAFANNLSFHAVDLARMSPTRLGSLLERVTAEIDEGRLEPLVREIFPLARVADAFRHISGAKHTGKVVVTVSRGESKRAIRADRSYLVTGGLGGIGRCVVEALVDRGARHVTINSRRAPTQEQSRWMTSLAPAAVTHQVADVADEHQVEALVRCEPPLAGVFHAAGVLDDGILLRQTPERFEAVLAPKVAGAAALDRHTRDLDHFVLFSSASGWLGSPGQSAYAAANTYLDGLASARRVRGERGLSVAFGPWSEVGMVADRGERLGALGVRSLTPTEGIEQLFSLLDASEPSVAVMGFDVRQWQQSHPRVAASPMFEGLVAPPTERASGSSVRAAIEAADDPRSALVEHLRTLVGRVLRLRPERIDTCAPLGGLGLDSLTALELRNRIEADLGVALSPTVTWSYPDLDALAGHLAESLSFAGPSSADTSNSDAPDDELDAGEFATGELDAGEYPGELDALSDDEALRLLAADEDD